MDKRIVLVLLAAMLVGGWLWWSRDDASATTPTAPNANRADAGTVASAIPASAAAPGELAAAREAAPAAPAVSTDPGAADAEPTGELLVRVVWSDGEKAPGVCVYLARSVPGGSRPLAELVANDAGEASAKVTAGKVRVTSDRRRTGDKELDVDVAAGERQEVQLQLADGVEVEGTVRDAAGAAVAGARIWVSSWQSPWCAGAFLAESGAEGTFQVRDVPKGQSLGAVAKGFAPSKLVDLDLLDTKQQPVRVELVLTEPGGALAGRVTDAQGKPVAGAVVAVGEPERHMNHRTGDSFEEAWRPLRAITGEDGRYTIEGLAPGEQPVEVFAVGFAYWHGKAAITAAETTPLDVLLQRGVTVFGTVTGEDRKPLAGAMVRCFPRPIERPFLQGGQYDYDSTFGCAFAVADDAGRFRMFGAASPTLHLFAGPGGYRRHNDTVCWAEEVMQAEPGAVVEWNAKVEPGLQIRGVVRYRDGEPMGDVFITAVPAGTKERQSLVNGTDGRFRFVHLEKKPYDVSVQVWNPPKDAPPIEAREVWPESNELVLTATFDSPKKQAPGSVRGTIADTAGRLANPGALAVILATDKGSWWTQSNLSGSSFQFKDIDPGRVRVIAMSGEDPILYGQWVELGPGEQKDLGTLVTEPGGSLRLRIVRGPGAEDFAPILYVTPVGGSHGRKVELPKRVGELLLENLSTGAHRVSAYGKGMASVREAQCTVVAGAEATATVELRAAVEREIVVEYEPTQRITLIRVQDERGNKHFDYTQPRAMERPYRMRLQLPIGSFTFTVETEGGGKAETTFEMTSLAENQPPVVLQAR